MPYGCRFSGIYDAQDQSGYPRLFFMRTMDTIRDRAGSWHSIIKDAAEAIESEYYGKCAGSFGDMRVFSIHWSKTITTGEEGCLSLTGRI